MSRLIQAIYANGVFTPLGPVDLPDQTPVEFEPRVCGGDAQPKTDGFLRTEGALAGDTEWDSVMAEVHQGRKLDRHSTMPGLDEQ